MSECDAFGLQRSDAAQEVQAVIMAVNLWKDHFAQAGVSPTDITSLAERIDGDALITQRTTFNRDLYQQQAKRRRISPFKRS